MKVCNLSTLCEIPFNRLATISLMYTIHKGSSLESNYLQLHFMNVFFRQSQQSLLSSTRTSASTTSFPLKEMVGTLCNAASVFSRSVALGSLVIDISSHFYEFKNWRDFESWLIRSSCSFTRAESNWIYIYLINKMKWISLLPMLP